MRILKNILLGSNLYKLFSVNIIVFILAFSFPNLLIIGKIFLAVSIAITVTDFVLLFANNIRFEVIRTLSKIMSLGHENTISIDILANTPVKLNVTIIDELPEQLQKRDFEMSASFNSGEFKSLQYSIKPLTRGIYNFGDIHLIILSPLKLIARKITIKALKEVTVYPSVAEMKYFELKTFSEISTIQGIRKLRRIGHSYEFEQIKEYVYGDEYRKVNWKATSRKGKLMVNQFQEEKSQQIFCIIDTCRVMQLPFNGLSLLDYSINSSLVILNIALKKEDKVGLITFNSKQASILNADKSRGQLKKVLEKLYYIKDQDLESNYELLYTSVRNKIAQRSLLFFFTNFESQYGLERVLPILRKLNKLHLLVVVFFENEEVSNLSIGQANNLEEVYIQAMAQQFVSTKYQLAQTLKIHGIQVIFTKPKDLSMNTINKYLELKARGLI
jgi:uncharacterized protein (DUF58 family)